MKKSPARCISRRARLTKNATTAIVRAVHWDMVLIQRPEWGGGEVWFDGELIRKDGMFLPKDLKPLNPANLK